MKEIPLTQGKVTLVDDEDYEWLMQWKWHAIKVKHMWYAIRNDGRNHPKSVYMHRAIVNALPKEKVDHRDRDSLRNIKSNLRKCTNTENMRNTLAHKDNKTGYKGIWKKRSKYYARISVEGKRINIGSFKTPEEAARAYDEAAKKYFGEFARLNFPIS